MKKLLVIALGLTCATSTFASSKSIPSQFRGCWQEGTLEGQIVSYEITGNRIEFGNQYDGIYGSGKVMSVSQSGKNAVKVKTKFEYEVEGDSVAEISTDTYKLLNNNTLQVGKGTAKYKKVKCQR